MACETHGPIAVVGMSCRFPGGANDAEKLWSLLSEGKSAWQDVPSDRFDWKSFYHPSTNINGTMNHRGGHFLDQDISAFDAKFFSIPSSEAHAMDPQQRIQLETAYEALENAGISLDQIRDSNTAVYIAIFSRDYDRMMFKDTSDIAKYHMIGAGDAIISNRISYVLDLKGPSMTLDTGCSGSLVAIHQACQSLRTGESNMALVGGTNLMLSPDSMIPMSLLHVLNADGKCYSFDDRGAGYGRGEGVATIVLKRLEDALEAGDTVRAIVRDSGVNQDGKTSGLTSPSPSAQQSLIRSIYSRAGIDPRHVEYVEAHGTGTVAGDLTELQSIVTSFCSNRDTSLYVGSIKSNIGHLEGASGIAGLIKAILILEKGLIPQNVNMARMKKAPSLEMGKLKIPRALEPWPATYLGLRYAAVNSFGYGGTNAHVILQAVTGPVDPAKSTETPATNTNAATANEKTCRDPTTLTDSKSTCGSQYLVTNLEKTGRFCTNPDNRIMEKVGIPQLLIMTAKSEGSLLEILKNIQKWASHRAMNKENLCDLAHTLSSRRSIMEWRYSIVATSHQDISSLLSNGALQLHRASPGSSVAFLFTGQGAQWFAMGRDLINSQSGFRDSLNTSEQILNSLGAPWRLVEELLRDPSDSRLNEKSISQPATTALQIALVDLLSFFGVQPSTVLGHSSGEIAAAYAARVLSRANALKVSFHRGSVLLDAEMGKGAMLAVGLGEKEVLTYISQIRNGTVSVACVNSPSNTTISGDEVAITELRSLFACRSIFNQALKVDAAYHSYHMEKVAESYLDRLHGLEVNSISDSIRFISSVTGREKMAGFGPSYWIRNLVSKVQYSAALDTLSQTQLHGPRESKMNLLIEIGPHSALAGPTHQTLKYLNRSSFQYHYLPSLLREQNSLHNVMHLAGKLFEFGYSTRIDAVNELGGSRRPWTVINDLPPYSWDHSTKYWHESRLSKDHRLRTNPYHDLLGLRIVSGSALDYTWRNMISMDDLPWLRDHIIDSHVIFPGAGYLCMAIEATRQVVQERRIADGIHQFTMQDVVFSKPLMIPDSPGKLEVQLSLITRHGLMSNSRGWSEFFVSSFFNGAWNEHCRGTIMTEFDSSTDQIQTSREEFLASAAKKEIFHNMKDVCTQAIETKELYSGLESKGHYYGYNFAVLQNLQIGDLEAIAKICIPDIAASMPSRFMQPHIIHPVTLDALFQVAIPLFLRHNSFGCVMPASVKEIVVSANILNRAGGELLVGANIAPQGRRSATMNALAFELDDHCELKPMISVSQVELCATGDAHEVKSGSQAGQSMTYQMEWGPDVNFLTSASNSIKAAVLSEKDSLSLEQKAENLDRAAALYIKLCLNRLDEESWDVSQEHMVYMLDWMRHFSMSESNKRLVADMSSIEIMGAIQNIPKPGVEGEALSRVGDRLSSILAGRLDPLSVLLEGDLLNRLYLCDDSSVQCCSHLAKYVRHLFFKNPDMTILEIGAGTGGTTWPLLQSFGENRNLVRQYDYTDISSGFFPSAQSLFHDWSDFMRFKILDIERDPKDQGFEEATYDLIIASNVLHTTAQLDRTLGNVRKLLKPGGRLALIEVTRLVPFVNVIFGMLPGWWKGIQDGRKHCPLLSVEQWHNLLSRNFFTGVETAIRDFDSPVSKATMMISRTIGTKDSATSDTAAQPNIEIVLAEALEGNFRGLSRGLSSSLVNRGFSCNLTSLPWKRIYDQSIYVILDSSERSLLVDPHAERFAQITMLLTQGKRVLWVILQENPSTKTHPGGGLVTGLARVARSENEVLSLVTLDIQQVIEPNDRNAIQTISDIIFASFGKEADGNQIELEYAYRDDQVFIPRLVPDLRIDSLVRTTTDVPQVGMSLFHEPQRPLKLHVETPGLLDSLIFIDDDSTLLALNSDQIEVQVKACGINFKDVFLALGRMKVSTQMAGECAGVVTAVGSDLHTRFRVGDRVCAWNGTSYASRSRVKGSDACLMPDSLSFATGASIPVIFLTAYYSLVEIAKLQKNHTVLIHAASGGVGQAAIMVAKHIGAEIYATASSDTKRRLIMETYDIAESHIFSNQSRGFREGITRLTQGKGVDVVLNSLSGTALQDSWYCIAEFGTFIELSKTDIYRKGQIDMEPFDRNVTFASVDLGAVARCRPDRIRDIFGKIMSMFEHRSLKAVRPVTKMAITDIESAFRLIQARKHNGKIVLEARDDTMVKSLTTKPTVLHLDGTGTYCVVGGLGDIGQNICRLLASHGATNLLILSRRTPSPERRRLIESDLASYGAKAHVMTCDIGDADNVRDVMRSYQATEPGIKGIIQAAMVLQDRILEQMTVDDLQIAIHSKYYGTNNLIRELEHSSLEFFIMLSSISSIVGAKAQANYAAGSAFQDSLAQSRFDSSTHYLSLDLGMIDDTDVIASHRERRSNLLRGGFIPLRQEQVLSLLKYSMSAQARLDRSKQIVIGFNRKSLSSQQGLRTLQNPLFSHLPRDGSSGRSESKAHASKSINAAITAAADIIEVHEIVATALMGHFSSLVAVDSDKIRLDSRVGDLGIDSLIAIELKNWISRTLEADIQTSEIVDAIDLRELVTKVTQRSRFVIAYLSSHTHENVERDRKQPESQVSSYPASVTDSMALMPLPVPNLDQSLELYYNSVRAFLSDDNDKITRSAIQDFQQRGGLGQILQGRLSQRAADPQTGNWMSELYNAPYWLKMRRPVNPFQHFFGSHIESEFQHCQAERAAVICAAAFSFKTYLETAEVRPDHLNDQPLCMTSTKWIFNTSREPHNGIDKVRKFPSVDFLVALRRGHFYKISLKHNLGFPTFSMLKETFQRILDMDRDSAPSIATLTADNRNGWAKTREMVQELSPSNRVLLETIEAAAFIVCLDDGSPSTSSERANQFLLGDVSSRWSDKILQFVICENGASATLCEHSVVDGSTLQQLNECVKKAIGEHVRDAERDCSLLQLDSESVRTEEYTFVSNFEIESQIRRVERQFHATTSPTEYIHYICNSFGGVFLRAHRCAPKVGYQLIMQLASQRYFGHLPPCQEAVSTQTFHKGRLDHMQTVLPPVAEFCKAMSDITASANARRRLFYEASKAYSSTLTRVSRGRGFTGHLFALRELIGDGKEVPSLFRDPAYANTPAKIWTSSVPWHDDLQEAGALRWDPESIWIHYDVEDERCRYSLQGPTGKTTIFSDLIENAARALKELLDGE